MGQKHGEISGPVCLSNVMFALLPLKVAERTLFLSPEIGSIVIQNQG